MTSPTSLMAKWRCSGVPAGSGDTQPPTGVVPCAHGHGTCSDCGRTCSDAARASAGWSEAWSIYPPWAGCAPDPDWATDGGPLTANFRGTRVGKKGERLSENQLNTSNKAWQQCGVEEKWKGWQLLLRRLPAAAKSLSSHLFTHAHKSPAGATFFPTNPHSGTRTVWQPARRGNKKLEKILNSREWIAARRGHSQAQGQPGLDKFQVRQMPALCPE